MSSNNIFSYNADCKQPDPEIWGGGVVGGPLAIVSGLEYAEKKSYRYSLTSSPGFSLVGELNFSSGLSSEYNIKSYVSSSLTLNLFGTTLDSILYYAPRTKLDIQLTGSASEYLISKQISEVSNIQTNGSLVEKVSYDYNSDSIETFLIGGLASFKFISSAPKLTTLITLFENSKESASYIPPINPRIFESNFNSTQSTFDNDNLTFDSEEPKPNIVFSGTAVEYFISNTPEDAVNIITSITSIERVSYDYNDSAIVTIQSDDYESISSIPTQSENYGDISAEVSQGNEDYDLIISNSTNTPFGSLNLNGSAFVVQPPDIRTYNASGEYRVTYNPPENVVSLLNFGEKSERVIYSYNIDSSNIFVSEDSGSILDAVGSIEDSGLLDEVITEFIDYEEIDITGNNNPFGSFNLNGSANTEWINKNFSSEGQYRVVYSPDNTEGTLFSFSEKLESFSYVYNENSIVSFIIEDSGSITSSVTEIEDLGLITDFVTGIEEYGNLDIISDAIPFGSFNLNGSANTEWINKNFSAHGDYSVVYSPDNTEGTLFSFGERIEYVVYDYNIDSILFVSDTDYGQVNGVYTSEDSYGLISEIASQSDNYGTLIDPNITEDVYPYGQFSISGESIEKNTESYVASPQIITISGSSSDLKFVTQYPESTTLFVISGTSGIEPVVYSEVGNGSLFSFGEKQESITYDYNENSINELIPENYGLISAPVSEIDDYGLIINLLDEQESYGEIDQADTLIPFGKLTLSGSASVIFENYNIYGEAVVKLTYSPDDIGGSLLTFGEKIESVAYDYNEDSIVVFVNEDSGSISVVATENDDYGSISEIYGQVVDYGDDDGIIVGFGASESLIPFGSLQLSGTSGNIIIGYGQENTALFTISGELNPPNIDYTPAIRGSGNIQINGSADNAFVLSNLTEGIDDITISEIGLKSRTYSYNESSTLSNVTPDYGLITTDPTESADDFGFVNQTGESDDYGSVTSSADIINPFGTLTISGTTLVYPEVDYTPSPDGSGIINITGSATYSETDAFGVDRRRGGTINLCGDALYSETDVYVGFGTIFLDQQAETVAAVLARTRSYVGIETIILSDSGLESRTVFIPTSGIGTGFIGGTINILGNAIESFGANPPEDNYLFTFSGELVHPQIDYTPHYGIEKNIGIGTTGIQISGVVDDSAQRTSRGVGSIFIVNGFSPQDTEAYPGGPSVGRSWSYTRTTYITEPVSINISTGVALTNYYSPIYPRNALITDPSSGIGTIRINDDRGLTLYRATLPYNARGTIFISGIGAESFAETTYIGTGTLTFSGISSNREIAVYQGYVTGGLITISQQTAPIIEKNTESYFGTGTIFVSESLIEREVESYSGSGTLFTLSGASEAYSAQTPEQTANIIVSGTAQESFIAQTPEQTVLYEFSGAATDEKLVKDYDGSGSININGSVGVRFSPQYPSRGTFRFVKYTSDEIYDTCDSVDVTSDYLDSAKVSFVANPPEDVVLFNINGNADTRETALETYFSFGTISFAASESIVAFSANYTNTQLFTISAISNTSVSKVSVGIGTIFVGSSSQNALASKTPENVVLINISGSSSTKLEQEYTYVGINLATFTGSAETAIFKTYTNVGSGLITLSGELLYPNIIFIPSKIGGGTFNLSGIGSESIAIITQSTGTLFALSSGFESTTKSTYIGIGTVYIQEISSTTINNPFQIPRTYVTII
jgi:hypothetical protein